MEKTLIVILVAILVATFFLMWRNNQVCDFRIEINHKCNDVLRDFLYTIKNDKELDERYGEYEQLEMKADEIPSKHSYASMLFSLKPLKPEYWFTNEEIEFMNLRFQAKEGE